MFLCIFAVTIMESVSSTLSPSTVQNIVLHLWERGLWVIKYKLFSKCNKLWNCFLSCIYIKDVFWKAQRHEKKNEGALRYCAIQLFTSRGQSCTKLEFKENNTWGETTCWYNIWHTVNSSCVRKGERLPRASTTMQGKCELEKPESRLSRSGCRTEEWQWQGSPYQKRGFRKPHHK